MFSTRDSSRQPYFFDKSLNLLFLLCAFGSWWLTVTFFGLCAFMRYLPYTDPWIQLSVNQIRDKCQEYIDERDEYDDALHHWKIESQD